MRYSKKSKLFTRNILLLLALFLSFLFSLPVLAAESAARPMVLYAGVMAMNDRQDDLSLFRRNKDQIERQIIDALNAENEQNRLPFSLVIYTDVETQKRQVEDYPLGIAFVANRDDIVTEKFDAGNGALAVKTIVNSGLTALVYSSEIIGGEKQNRVIASIPLNGYWEQDESSELSQLQQDTVFVQAATKLFKEFVIPKLTQLRFDQIEGTVTAVQGEKVLLSIGHGNRLQEGQHVNFMVNGRRMGSGLVTTIQANSATAKVIEPPDFSPTAGMKVTAVDVRKSSFDTYQVVDSKVTSRKAGEKFQDLPMGPRLAEWFSAYLVEQKGVVVFPPATGGNWIVNADQTMSLKLIRGGDQETYVFPVPKHKIMLDLTGINSGVVSGDSVKQYMVFKTWLKVDMPGNMPNADYSKTFDVYVQKLVAKNSQKYNDRDVFFQLIQQVSLKAAKEGTY